ncbi:MAG: hypothetical protein STSR0009_11310 [Methanoregula sp.]
MAGIYCNRGKSGERIIKAGTGYAEVPGCAVIACPTGIKKTEIQGYNRPVKKSDRNPKKMRRRYRFTGMDEEHGCRDMGIEP